jgi:hypothetical protein
METKLTLKLDKNTIDQAKLYAKDNNLSLSKMVCQASIILPFQRQL